MRQKLKLHRNATKIHPGHFARIGGDWKFKWKHEGISYNNQYVHDNICTILTLQNNAEICLDSTTLPTLWETPNHAHLQKLFYQMCAMIKNINKL